MKSNLGISVGFLAALVFISGLLNYYLAVMLLVAYILIKEDNAWLRKTAVQGLVVLLAFNVIPVFIDILPKIVNIFADFFSIFEVDIRPYRLITFFSVIKSIISLIEIPVYLGLAFFAFKEKDIKIPVPGNMV